MLVKPSAFESAIQPFANSGSFAPDFQKGIALFEEQPVPSALPMKTKAAVST
ncbi:MAG: hypothetical protein PUH30_03605 [Oscillospiraceae bacterium]|nr:hypothetical protein [Oscillospiraceae bacterium]